VSDSGQGEHRRPRSREGTHPDRSSCVRNTETRSGSRHVSGLDSDTVEFLTKASGGPIGEVWAMLGAHVRYLRWILAVRFAERAAAFLGGRFLWLRQPSRMTRH
jgi:hypothetical protein